MWKTQKQFDRCYFCVFHILKSQKFIQSHPLKMLKTQNHIFKGHRVNKSYLTDNYAEVRLTLRDQALTPHKSLILCFNIFLDRGIYFCIFNIFLHSFSIDFIDYLYTFLAFLDKGFSLFSTSPVNTYFPITGKTSKINLQFTYYFLFPYPF